MTPAFRSISFLSLLRLELRRLFFSRRMFVVLLLVFVAALCQFYEHFHEHLHGYPGGVFGIISLSDFMLELYPFILGLAVADSLAVDIYSGYLPMVLARGVPRGKYFVAKGFAAMLVVAGLVIVHHIILIGLGFLFLPWKDFCDAAFYLASKKNYFDYCRPPGPLRALFISTPWAHDLLVLAMTCVSNASFVLVGLAVSALRATPYLAAAAPFFFFYLARYPLKEMLGHFNPARYYIWADYTLPYVSASVPIWFLYWFLFAVLMVASACIIAKKRELGVYK